MAQIFAYILHKDGVVDDTALELAAAAKKIDAGATPNAIVVGAGEVVLLGVVDQERLQRGEVRLLLEHGGAGRVRLPDVVRPHLQHQAQHSRRLGRRTGGAAEAGGVAAAGRGDARRTRS